MNEEQATGQHETPAPVTIEAPTVGRRVWYWSGQDCPAPLNALDPHQPFDAGVVYVLPPSADGHHRVNLLVTDHCGQTAAMHGVVLFNPFDCDVHGERDDGYATWMPYQRAKQIEKT